MILGGQFVSRINLNLREDKGFTYGARTSFEFRRRPGPFVLQVSVQTAATAQAIEESIGEIAGIRGPRPVTAEELVARHRGADARLRAQLRNGRADRRARVMQLALYDLPDDYFAHVRPDVERVTRDDVSRVMTQHLDPARLTTLVVGDLDVIGDDLGRLGSRRAAGPVRRGVLIGWRPVRMKAVRFHAHGGAEVLRFEDAPDPVLAPAKCSSACAPAR